jgi:ABC-type uncharacterized transport system auxiliary subunit
VIRLLAILVLLTGLAACGGNVAPAPEERFYRLQVTALTDSGPAAGLAVGRFFADSIYAERPLVYGDPADPHSARQYHYHLWLYPPAELVRDHLAQTLGVRQADFAERRIEGRVLRFDRVGRQAKVEVELRVVHGREAVFDRRYAAEESASGDGVRAHVEATERALATIYVRFIADLRARR